MHDLAHMALAERIDEQELGGFLAGCRSAQKGIADAASDHGLAAWVAATEDLPAFAVRQAFWEWLKREEWQPNSGGIRAIAQRKAEMLERLCADCKAVLVIGDGLAHV